MSVARARFAFTGDFPPGTFDASALGQSFLSLSVLCEAANKRLNGDRASANVRIHASFKAASFDVVYEMVQGVSDQVRTLLGMKPAIVGPAEILALLGFGVASTVKVGHSVLDLVKKWKEIRGEPTATVKLDKEGLREITISGVATKVLPQVLDLVEDAEVRRAIPKILSPLRLPGVKSFEVRSPDRRVKQPVAVVRREELPAFEEPYLPPVVVEPVKELHSGERTTVLQIVRSALVGSLDWTFSEGGGPDFSAPVEDAAFLARRDAGEAFRAGDYLRVRIHSTTTAGGGRGALKQRVVKVLEHIERPSESQGRLLPP